MNVSSIIVTTKPKHLEYVIECINTIDLCEVHFYDAEGKIVVTIEGETIEEQMERMKKIQSIPHVYSANLSYSYCEDELTEGLDKILNESESVPEKLH